MKKHAGDLSTYKTKFLDCRPGNTGHRWRWEEDFHILRNRKGDIIEFRRKMKCVNCTSTRTKIYDGQGRIIKKGGYDYVDGYQIDGDKVSFGPGTAALESLRRALEAGRVEEEVEP